MTSGRSFQHVRLCSVPTANSADTCCQEPEKEEDTQREQEGRVEEERDPRVKEKTALS